MSNFSFDGPDTPGLGPYMQELVNLHQMQKNQSQKAHDFLSEMIDVHLKAMDKMIHSSIAHLQMFFDELEQQVDQTTSKVSERLGILSNKFDEFGDKVRKHSSGSNGPLGFWGGVGQIATALQLQQHLSQIVSTMVELSRQTDGLLRTFGGSQERLNQFTNQIVGVQHVTHLATKEVIELGNAFQQQGMDVSNHTPELMSYMKVTGQAMHMLDLSAESAVTYSKNLKDIGRSSKYVANSYDDMYRTAQKANLTIEDMADSVMTANQLFGQFSMMSGQGVDGLSKNLLETKALMKSLGEDSKQAGGIIAAELGSVNQRTQEAGLMASLIGGNMFDHFNNLPTAEGQRMKRVAALTAVSRMAGPLLFQDPSQLSAQQNYQRSIRIAGGVDTVSQQLGLSPGDLQRELAEFQAARKDHAGMSIREFYDERQREMESKQPPKSWQQGQESFNKSIGQLGKNLEHLLTDLSIIVGGPLMKVLNPLVEGLNWLLDTFIELEEKNPFVKAMTEFAVVGAAFGAIAGPIAAFASKVVPLMTGVSEGLAAMFTGIRTLLPVIEGTSLTPTAVLTVFTPVIGLLVSRFENFFSDFIPRWIKDIWQGAMNSDLGRGIQNGFDTVQKGFQNFYDSLPSWMKGTNFSNSGSQQAASLNPLNPLSGPGLSNESIRQVIQHGTSATTKQALMSPVSYDTGSPASLAKKLKGFHPHAYKNAGIVMEEARKAGADPAMMVATMLLESRGDEGISGDRGFFQGKRFISSPKGAPTSFGLFQLHKGGRLTAAHLTPEQAFNAHTNASTQAGEFAKYARSHPNWSPGRIAAFTQGPASPDHYARTVDSLMPLAREIVAAQDGKLNLMKSSLSSTPDLGWYRHQQDGHIGEKETVKVLKEIHSNQVKQMQKNDEAERIKRRMMQTDTNGSAKDASYFADKGGANVL